MKTDKENLIILAEGFVQYATESMKAAAKHGNFDLMNLNQSMMLAEKIIRENKIIKNESEISGRDLEWKDSLDGKELYGIDVADGKTIYSIVRGEKTKRVTILKRRYNISMYEKMDASKESCENEYIAMVFCLENFKHDKGVFTNQ